MVDRRGIFVAFIILLCLGVGVFNIVVGAPGSKSVVGKSLRANPSHGWIKLPSISASGISHDSDYFYFTGLGSVVLGFDPHTGANMTSLTIGDGSISFTLSNAGKIGVYSGSGRPLLVTGGSYYWDGVAAVVTTEGAGRVTVDWVYNQPQQVAVNIQSVYIIAAVLPVLLGAVVISLVMKGSDPSSVLFMVVATVIVLMLGVMIISSMIRVM